MTCSKLISLWMLLFVAACTEASDPVIDDLEPESSATEPAVEVDEVPSIADEDWYDPTPKEIQQLPPKWEAAGMQLEMLNPHLAREKAPETFQFELKTTKGDIVVECVRAWSPHGVDRVYNLLKIGFFKDVAIYRVVEDFVVQFGIHGNTGVSTIWNKANIRDDPPFQSNRRGYVTLSSMRGRPNTRSTEIFINLSDNTMLDERGFTPVGRIVKGLSIVDTFNGEYAGRALPKYIREGNMSIRDRFPRMDYLKSAALIE
ncbi:MAG: peptidyl-prolyl cis-trans isomerase A (cyclophilin A) [Planctomycetota bacterium]|jgi:peptidyl-prolyl cis-trans isomerase A (cyclophilin A)